MAETASVQAGAELDAEIDRVVFGKTWAKHPYCVVNGVRQDIETWLPDEDWCSPDDPPGGWTWGEKPPPYSTDPGVAMTVFEAMVEMTGHGEIVADMEDCRGEGFVVSVIFGFDEESVGAIGPLPLAVCRAALGTDTAPRPGEGQ